MNFVWTPVPAGVLGWVLLSGHPELRLGLVMLLVTPCTDWYLVFTGAARGNVPLAGSLLPPNLVLQLLLLPLFVTVLTGTAADVPLGELARSIAVILGVPLAIAASVRSAAARADAHDQLDAALERAQPLGLGLLAVAIAALCASARPDGRRQRGCLHPAPRPAHRLLRDDLPGRTTRHTMTPECAVGDGTPLLAAVPNAKNLRIGFWTGHVAG